MNRKLSNLANSTSTYRIQSTELIGSLLLYLFGLHILRPFSSHFSFDFFYFFSLLLYCCYCWWYTICHRIEFVCLSFGLMFVLLFKLNAMEVTNKHICVSAYSTYWNVFFYSSSLCCFCLCFAYWIVLQPTINWYLMVQTIFRGILTMFFYSIHCVNFRIYKLKQFNLLN